MLRGYEAARLLGASRAGALEATPATGIMGGIEGGWGRGIKEGLSPFEEKEESS